MGSISIGFWWVLMAFGGFWCFLVGSGLWWVLVSSGVLWCVLIGWCVLVSSDAFWCVLVGFGEFLWALVRFDAFW
jgi:hypothetical protein